MWYVKDDANLGFLDEDKKYRLDKTIEATAVSRKIMAFQVGRHDCRCICGLVSPVGHTDEDAHPY